MNLKLKHLLENESRALHHALIYRVDVSLMILLLWPDSVQVVEINAKLKGLLENEFRTLECFKRENAARKAEAAKSAGTSAPGAVSAAVV